MNFVFCLKNSLRVYISQIGTLGANWFYVGHETRIPLHVFGISMRAKPRSCICVHMDVIISQLE